MALSILASNSLFMNAPFGDFGWVRPPLSSDWGVHPFPTHRQDNWRAVCDAVLPRICAEFSNTFLGNLGARAVGGFSFHAPMVLFFEPLSYTTALNKVE